MIYLDYQATTPLAPEARDEMLRKKLERDPDRPRHILTVHGVGYRFSRRGEEV